MKEYKIENHESSLLPQGNKWKPVWSDEFDMAYVQTLNDLKNEKMLRDAEQA